MTVKLPIERDGVEVIAEVSLYYSRGRKGTRDTICRRGDGPPIEPDDEETLEVDDSDWPLTKQEEEQAVEMGWKDIYD